MRRASLMYFGVEKGGSGSSLGRLCHMINVVPITPVLLVMVHRPFPSLTAVPRPPASLAVIMCGLLIIKLALILCPHRSGRGM